MREGGRLSSHPCILSLFFLIAVIDIVRPFLSCAHCQGTGAPSNLSRRSSIVSFDIVEIVSNPHEIWGEGVLLFVVFHSLSFAFSFLACWRRCGALNLEGEWYLIHSILWIVLFYLVLLSGVGRQDSRMESFWCFSIRLCGGNLVGLVSFGLGHVILRSCSNLSFPGRALYGFLAHFYNGECVVACRMSLKAVFLFNALCTHKSNSIFATLKWRGYPHVPQ